MFFALPEFDPTRMPAVRTWMLTHRASVCKLQQAATGGSSQMLPHLNHSPGRGRTTTSRTAAPCKGRRVDAGHHVRGSVRDEASCRLRPGIKDCREECAPTVNFTCLLWNGCGAGWQIRAFTQDLSLAIGHFELQSKCSNRV
jgi:hypothetical protein